MFNFIIGKLIEKSPTVVVVEANGIGYELMVPVSTSQRLPASGETIKLLTHFVVREDAHLLFGFATAEEKSLFRLLLSVSGIGPKLAITVLSGIEINELKQCIVQGLVPALTSIPGIGRKTAERIIIELREKVAVERGKESEVGLTPAHAGTNALLEDTLQALISLGYSKQSAKNAIKKAFSGKQEEEWDAQELIRASLRVM